MSLNNAFSLRSFIFAIIVSVLCPLWGCTKDEIFFNDANSTSERYDTNRFDNSRYLINIENNLVRAFLDTKYDSNDYTYTHVSDYVTIEQTERKDIAEGIFLEWHNIEGSESTHIVYATNPDFEEAITIIVNKGSSSYKLCNLVPNQNYWLKIINNDTDIIKQFSFATEGRRRLINLSIGFNCRDIGGVKTIDNRTIKYGLLFRGGELDGRGQVLEDYDHDVLENVLKIKDVFDFRAIDSATKTPIVGAEYHSLPLYSMIGIYNRDNPELDSTILNNYKASLLILLNCLREGHPVYAHCQGGCDRTNTMFFLIMGVLGVEENDLALDYELSSFAQGARYAYNTTGGMIRSRDPSTNKYHNNYKNAVEYIKSKEGVTLKEKFESFWINDLGVTREQIEELRSYLLDDFPEDNQTTSIPLITMDK